MRVNTDYRETQRVADLKACRQLLSGGSKSFYAASFLLPRRVRDPATALYAFCRLADDAIDLGEDSAAALAMLRDRLDKAYAGQPENHPADRALADTMATFAIPKQLPGALIEGFAWDHEQRAYETLEDVLDYAARVAGTVGAMMSLLMGRREDTVVARACDLGMAMQLTNIARDVGEDAAMGRLYLPRDWLGEAGLDPDAWLRDPKFCPEIAAVIARLLKSADELYARADLGISQLPADCRPGIAAARLLYSEIGREVERRTWNSIDSRAFVPGRRKIELLFAAVQTVMIKAQWSELPVHSSSRFLIEAARATRHGGPHLPGQIAWWDVRGRLMFVFNLFDKLERRERARPQPYRELSMVSEPT